MSKRLEWHYYLTLLDNVLKDRSGACPCRELESTEITPPYIDVDDVPLQRIVFNFIEYLISTLLYQSTTWLPCT
jgi:hypothetical protein